MNIIDKSVVINIPLAPVMPERTPLIIRRKNIHFLVLGSIRAIEPDIKKGIWRTDISLSKKNPNKGHNILLKTL